MILPSWEREFTLAATDPSAVQTPSLIDGFVKSPSAALRFNFVVAAHL